MYDRTKSRGGGRGGGGGKGGGQQRLGRTMDTGGQSISRNASSLECHGEENASHTEEVGVTLSRKEQEL